MNVESLVTDYARGQQWLAYAGILTRYSDSSLQANGCQAHMMNPLAEDITESESVVNEVVPVIEHLRNHHAESAEMKHMSVPKPLIPCDARWNSVNEISLKMVKHCHRQDTGAIYRYMEDVQLKRFVTKMLLTFPPIGKALNGLQMDTALLAWFLTISIICQPHV